MGEESKSTTLAETEALLKEMGEEPRGVRGRKFGRFTVDLAPKSGEFERWALFLDDGTLLVIKVTYRELLETFNYRGWAFSAKVAFQTRAARDLDRVSS